MAACWTHWCISASSHAETMKEAGEPMAATVGGPTGTPCTTDGGKGTAATVGTSACVDEA